jgi:hypothetical protein
MWQTPSPARANAVLKQLSVDATSGSAEVRTARTVGFGAYELVHVIFGDREEATYDLLAATGPDGLTEGPLLVNWTGDVIANVAEKSHAELSAYPVDYLRIFSALIGNNAGRFPIVDRDDLLPGRDEALPLTADTEAGRTLRAKLRDCSPPRLLAVAANGALRYEAYIWYSGLLWLCNLELGHDGRVAMKDHEQVWQQVWPKNA